MVAGTGGIVEGGDGGGGRVGGDHHHGFGSKVRVWKRRAREVEEEKGVELGSCYNQLPNLFFGEQCWELGDPVGAGSW